MKSPEPLLPVSNFPEEGLRFFHSLSNWVEQSKSSKPKLINWEHGHKRLTKLKCIKPKQWEQIQLPGVLPWNTLYVPWNSCGYYVICQLRHAFSHDNLVYDEKTGQYRIELTDKVKIAGRFSLDAIKEFVNVFLSGTKN